MNPLAPAADPRTRSETSELDRRIANLIRTARVFETDYPKRRVRVEDETWRSEWLPWLEHRAHEEASWSPPQIGERVLVLAPSGDPDQGIILTGLYCDPWPTPSIEPTVSMHRYADDSFEFHDSADSFWHFRLAPEGKFRWEVGPSSIEMDASGIRMRAPRIDLN